MTTDPLQEDYPNLSSYTFCHENPVNMIDPDGCGDYYTNKGIWLGTDKKNNNLTYLAEGVKNGKFINAKKVLLKFWYIYVSKFEETFICKREIDALPPIIRFAVFILLTEPSRIPLFNLLAIELLMAE